MISFFNKSRMSNTSDFSNQFVVLFEKTEMMTNYLKGLEQQNSILFKKVENIENYIFSNKIELNNTTAKQKMMKDENKLKDNDEEKVNEKKENRQRIMIQKRMKPKFNQMKRQLFLNYQQFQMKITLQDF